MWMKILIDTREQLPLKFEKDVVVESRRLDVGDYMAEIDGKVVPIAFERKGLGDLFGTMTQGYDRFKKEMMRAKESNTKLILVIEGSLSDVLEGYSHSQFEGKSMVMKLSMLTVKYDLTVHYFNNREEMARHIFEFYDAIERYWKKSNDINVLTKV